VRVSALHGAEGAADAFVELMSRFATLRQLGRVEFGPMRDDERNLVLSSWTASLVDSMGHGVRSGSKHRHAYLVSMGKLVDGLFERGLVLVARDAECQALAYGWVCGAGADLHWSFTKAAYRRLGVAAHLFAALQDELGPLERYTLRSRHSAVCERYGLRYAERGKVSA
jgi:GNAT superfamily N-acetyltransferase